MTPMSTLLATIVERAKSSGDIETADAEATAAARDRFVERQHRLRGLIEQRPIDAQLLARVKVHPSPSALLMGPTGIGKTSMAHWILAARRYLVVRSVDLADAEREHPLGHGAPVIVERARSFKYLILDDLGFERDVAAAQSLLDYRYSRCLPTIVTTGLTRDELTARTGAAYVRRIREQHAGPGTLVVDCFGETP